MPPKPKPGDRPKSDWSLPDRLGGLKVDRAEDSEPSDFGGHVLLVADAERIVENLCEFGLKDVGSKAWMEQHASIEKLNQQAHASARDKSDEFVLEAFLTFDKLGCLIYDLILIETWREKVYPLLRAGIVGEGEATESEKTRSKSMRCYFVLYHEATVVNLLECLCYHAHAVHAVKDAALDLTDYCSRRLAAMHSRAKAFRASRPARDADRCGSRRFSLRFFLGAVDRRLFFGPSPSAHARVPKPSSKPDVHSSPPPSAAATRRAPPCLPSSPPSAASLGRASALGDPRGDPRGDSRGDPRGEPRGDPRGDPRGRPSPSEKPSPSSSGS